MISELSKSILILPWKTTFPSFVRYHFWFVCPYFNSSVGHVSDIVPKTATQSCSIFFLLIFAPLEGPQCWSYSRSSTPASLSQYLDMIHILVFPQQGESLGLTSFPCSFCIPPVCYFFILASSYYILFLCQGENKFM